MTKPPEKSKIARKLRCAVYTRKSSEEGLEQEFNSLHAQREACEAYIASQRSEGWVLVRDQYDDGGISGGTLERPGLQRLIPRFQRKGNLPIICGGPAGIAADIQASLLTGNVSLNIGTVTVQGDVQLAISDVQRKVLSRCLQGIE